MVTNTATVAHDAYSVAKKFGTCYTPYNFVK